MPSTIGAEKKKYCSCWGEIVGSIRVPKVRKENGLPLDTELALRMRLVEHLERTRAITNDALRNAFATVPRHHFVPEVSLLDAYDDRALTIKERYGFALSSISQPSMIAHMLLLLDVHEGNRILEIGTGSGYNAALLAEITGPAGSVVTLEIEEDLIESARAHLQETGAANVSVLLASALHSLSGPFDRIIVTACNDDIDADWWRLLADGGRIVAPLNFGYGGERAYGFVRDGTRLISVGSSACSFIPLRERAHEQQGEFFFRHRHARYAAPPLATTPLAVVAMQRENARPELLSEADVVVARPVTVFAVTS